MKNLRPITPFRKILVPIVYGCDAAAVLTAARLAGGDGQVVLVGLVYVPPDESLSNGALPARQLRKHLRGLAHEQSSLSSARLRTKAVVFVSHTPWMELIGVIHDEQPDLLMMEWPCQLEALRITAEMALAHPPCDTALVRGPLPAALAGAHAQILVPIRGGPYAELALRLSLALGQTWPARLTSLHLRPSGDGQEAAKRDAPFRGIARVLSRLPEVNRREAETEDPAETILQVSQDFDLVVMSATAQPVHSSVSLGAVAERVLQESPAGVITVKAMRPVSAEIEGEAAGHTAISVLVDKWFAETTFHADEFAELEHLLALKREQGLTISLALPALNEEATVGKVIRTVQRALMEKVPLLDEVVLIDSNSTDRTRDIAQRLGVPVYIHQDILPEYGARRGKGEALWKSLYVTRGDLIVWIDTDIVNIRPHFVYGLLGPLLLNPRIQFVKGFYRRPLKVGDKVQAGGGGRVTELTARPLLNLFYPELSGVIQPLSGEYGGRRAALEGLPFFSGYGVETGLLIDTFEMFGLSAIAQVDLRERIHHNQPLAALSKMSFAIIQAVIRKLERRYGQAILEDVNTTMKLIRYEPRRFFLDVEEIAEKERPPMLTLPEYRVKRFGEGKAEV